MTTTFKRIIAAAIAFIAIAGIACAVVLSGGCSTDATSSVDEAKNGAVNAIIDLTGIKERIDSELRSRAGELASQAGASQALVDNVVDSLAIPQWQATSLPPDAVEAGTYEIELDGVTAHITTYDDPDIVTLEAYGQAITMEVPESARGYIKLAGYLDYLQ